MNIKLKNCVIRSWREKDAESLAYHANNRKIWVNLRDAFPHPYTLSDAYKFIEFAKSKDPETLFCISKNNEAIGSIGHSLQHDVERFSAEIGYWLGGRFWNRGIMTEALRAVTKHAIEIHNLSRVYALPFEWNHASFRVLEKAGYILEGRMRCSAFKDGKVIDQLLYAYVKERPAKIE